MHRTSNLFLSNSQWTEYRKDFDTVLTISDLRVMLPVSEKQIRYAIEHQHLCALKVGRIYLISARSAVDWFRKKSEHDKLSLTQN